jgi:hypothetical protein
VLSPLCSSRVCCSPLSIGMNAQEPPAQRLAKPVCMHIHFDIKHTYQNRDGQAYCLSLILLILFASIIIIIIHHTIICHFVSFFFFFSSLLINFFPLLFSSPFFSFPFLPNTEAKMKLINQRITKRQRKRVSVSFPPPLPLKIQQ